MNVRLQKMRGEKHWETSLKNIENVNKEIFSAILVIIIVKQSVLFFSIIVGLSEFLQ